jgi:ferredoxin
MIPSSERIGVYVCHCGTNISHTVDVGAVVTHAATLPGVVVAKEYKYMCSDPGQEIIRRDIEERGLTRVVVASCSPLMHETTFRKACDEAGLNPYLFQMANIREHCSWVHADREQATAKAQRLVRAAIQRVRNHVPLEEREVPVRPETLVVGGGITGIEAALRIADSGKKVYLVEKEPSIGGHMAKFDKTFPTLDCAACILTPKMVNVGQHPNIELLSYSEVEEVSGFVGNFKVKVRRKARYIDEDKCTGCGQCVENCLVRNQAYLEPPVLPAGELDETKRSLADRVAARHEGGADVEHDFTDGNPHGDLDQARVPDLADQRKHLGPLALFGPDGCKPGGSSKDDGGDVGPRLDIVDIHRLAPQRRARGALPRLGRLPFDRSDQRGRFAANKGPGPAADLDVEIEPASQDVGSQQAIVAGLTDGNAQPLDSQRILVADVHVPAAGADRVSADDHAFQDRMRIGLDNAAVHEGPRIAFIRVAHDVLGFSPRLAPALPLAARGKPRAPAIPTA